MNSLSTQRLVILVGVLLVLAFFGYSFFIKDSGSVDVISQSSSQGGDDILILVDTLNKISIDRSLFTSNLFLGLQDFSIELYPEPQGRPNPFAAVGSEGSFSAPTQQGSRTSAR